MYKLPDLPYPYDALEPHIDTLTMEIHHTKHHQGYTDKLNAALEGQKELANQPIEQILGNLNAVPDNIRTAVQNNGGGYVNHNLFWEIMSPDGGGEPEGELSEAIKGTFGSFDAFKEQFSEAAATRFGSGWAWLAVDGDDQLKTLSTANQDSPLSEGFAPILGLDVWEHAYYKKYGPARPDYIDAFWNIVNWPKVAENYTAAQG